MPDSIDFKSIERKWQEKWSEARCFQSNIQKGKQKFFITFPYPYVNGAPHVGHSYSCFRADVYARFKRMQGFNVLFPQGFHATGEPILGAVERLRKGDEKQIKSFKDYGVTDAQLEEFKKGPEQVARYWMQRWRDDLTLSGISIDWRRSFITTDLTPTYSRFIAWQYRSLKKKGYIVQGTHPVVYCPHDDSPTGDHDRLVGEGESPIEYTILKFSMPFENESLILPAATLRPETIYGVTNIWLHPKTPYVRAKVDGELWLLSEPAVRKLSDQGKKVKRIGPLDLSTLFGKTCINPVTNEDVLILPASFVSSENATGVVMSVPGHAPFDYVALRDLKRKIEKSTTNSLALEGIEFPRTILKQILEIHPLGLISVKGYGEFPAKDAVEKLKIYSQDERIKLDKATSEVYKHEFHQGQLSKRCGKYAGLTVSSCKEELVADFKGRQLASNIWEITDEVICRCTTKCHVKILENQWFLKFSDADWKQQVHSHLKHMRIFPEDARIQFTNTIDWLQNKACARKSGLGTKLPWDNQWIVETLSDSTIYMAYYTLSRIVNEHHLTAEHFTDEVFDHIFLAKNTPQEALKNSTLSPKLLEELRKEFEYFYPVDVRSSGKDLLQNHLTFFLFHHAALFDSRHWPQGIAVNGYVTVEGEKMSKSKGNFIPLRNLLNEYGTDLTRINMVAAGEGLDDADWKTETIAPFRRLLEFLYSTIQHPPTGGDGYGREEELLESRLNRCKRDSMEAYDRFEFRTASQCVFFESCHALRAYLRLSSKVNVGLMRRSLEDIVRMIAPLTPHMAEELWSMLQHEDFAACASYPSFNNEKIREDLEQEEKVLTDVASDVARILKLAKVKKPRLVRLFTAPPWKRRLLQTAINRAKETGYFDYASVLAVALKDEELKQRVPEVQAYIKTLAKAVNYYKTNPLPELDESQLLAQQKDVLERLLSCPVEVWAAENVPADKDKDGKARRASPFKPAIYVE
ncbi:leucine--tRNA ligase [Candidatus Micrarchaeota archaeon]|nr:leucine--tRNA ligase [Candidatus Micrarchaeota archaeon]